MLIVGKNLGGIMDRRTQNRLREHSGAGHELVERKVSVIKIGQRLFGCECGWFGWLMIGVN